MKKFGKVTVLKKIDAVFVLGKCDCGNEKKFYYYKLTSGHTRSCGCLKGRPAFNMQGEKFGKLTCTNEFERKNKTTWWKCRCDCGNYITTRHGDLQAGNKKSCGKCKFDQEYQERMKEKIKNNISINSNGCWIWKKKKDANGYGRVGYKGKQSYLVHRAMFELCIGDLINVLKICHNCPNGDNPSCCNPDHMFVGSQMDNIRDSMQKGRNYRMKFVEDDIRNIINLRKKGISAKDLAKKFKANVRTIYRILNREIWQHVKGV